SRSGRAVLGGPAGVPGPVRVAQLRTTVGVVDRARHRCLASSSVSPTSPGPCRCGVEEAGLHAAHRPRRRTTHAGDCGGTFRRIPYLHAAAGVLRTCLACAQDPRPGHPRTTKRHTDAAGSPWPPSSRDPAIGTGRRATSWLLPPDLCQLGSPYLAISQG